MGALCSVGAVNVLPFDPPTVQKLPHPWPPGLERTGNVGLREGAASAEFGEEVYFAAAFYSQGRPDSQAPDS
jgi:hypothetical protein